MATTSSFLIPPSYVKNNSHIKHRNSYGDHFLLPNSYITLQYFSLAYGDHFLLPNSYFTRQNSIIPEGD